MFLCLAIAVSFMAVNAGAAVTAASVMAGMRATITSSPAIEAVFTINGGDGPVQGSIEMSGARFALTTPQLRVWYDGKTQWSMLNSSKELNISEPTVDELTASNPFSILSNYADTYNIKLLPDHKNMRRVELTPRIKGNGIGRIIICADKSNRPTAFTISFDDGQQIAVSIDNFRSRKALPDKTFSYDAKLFPASETIDLR